MPKIYPITQIVIPHRLNPADELKYVMVQEKDSMLWGQPGGGINPGDHDYITAATREGEEETGLCVSIYGFLGIYNYKSINKNNIMSVALTARVISGSLCPRDKDIIKADLFSLAEIRRMNEREELRSGMANVSPIEEFARGNVLDLSKVFKKI